MNFFGKGIFLLSIVVGSLCSLPHFVAAEERRCTYNTWEWDTLGKRSVNHRRVEKPYGALTPEERDPHSGCTVCEEDQAAVELPGIPKFHICKLYASAVTAALKRVTESGFPVQSVVAYRVGRSKGEVDENGRRTQFSHHSFGSAIDINAERNGLYGNCVSFSPQCRLLRGGDWNPEQPGTITKSSIVYGAFLNMGWKWGGELPGGQKDFMHFSLSGD